MQKITNTLKLLGVALAALILAPVVALLGLAILGFATGAAALLTGAVTAMAWQHGKSAEAQTADTAANAPADAQPA